LKPQRSCHKVRTHGRLDTGAQDPPRGPGHGVPGKHGVLGQNAEERQSQTRQFLILGMLPLRTHYFRSIQLMCD